MVALTAGGDGGRFDRGKIRFWVRSFVVAARLYELDGGSGGERGLRLTSGERYLEQIFMGKDENDNKLSCLICTCIDTFDWTCNNPH